ncbi:MAG TPA: hypothetical protein VG722_05505, partial [Tepidisphaeraceae bacterium]|nr:hypothetical protein [Tepidisphaeraceae bacterium]
MRQRSIKSRAGSVALGAVLAGATSLLCANIAQAGFSLDLEANGKTPGQSGGSSITVAPGSPVSIEVYALVTDAGNSGTNDGFGGMFASFDASSSTSGSLGAMSMSINNIWKYEDGTSSSAQIGANGNAYGPVTDGSGNTHIGVGNLSSTSGQPIAYDSTSPNNWSFAAYLTSSPLSSINTGAGVALAGNAGAYFDLGTLTFTAGSSTGTVTVGATGRKQVDNTMVAALWGENGTPTIPAIGSAFGSDDSVTITVGSVGPQPHNGDTLPYDGHTVGFNDLLNVLNNYGTT